MAANSIIFMHHWLVMRQKYPQRHATITQIIVLLLHIHHSLHLQLHSGEQTRLTLRHLQFEQFHLQQHLISWLHA